MSHTPAPWKIWSDHLTPEVGHITIYANENDWIVSVNGRHVGVESDAETRANARRIVACVNACEGIETEMLEIPGLLKSPVAARTQELRTELKTLKAVNELLKFENERMMAELAQKELDRSKEHSEWILGKWNEDAKVFDARRKTDAEKAKMLLGKWEYVEQPEFGTKLKYASWDALNPKYKFQAYDMDGILIAYQFRPWLDGQTFEWRFPSGEFTLLFDNTQDGPIPNWQQTLIERQTDQDGPAEPDPCELAQDYEDMTYGADAPSEYDPS